MAETLEDIQDAILERLHAGERIDRDAILAAHPDHEKSLIGFLDLLEIIEGEPVPGGPEATRLGEFRIVREIGRGGMGIVYEAEQPSLRRRVALKVLPPSLRMDPRLVSRFHREAEAAGRLRHPGIVPVFSVGAAAGAPFFAMELVEGESLQALIARWRAGEDRPDRRRWAIETAAKVADALAYAHEQGILHRDVKPGNVIIDGSGEPRLTDFGLAFDMRAPGLTVPGEIFGSPQYMSPEQAVRQEAPIDERTDVYSLAVTLYELLTLRLPYDATTSAELLTALATGRLVPPRQADPTIPEALEAVLLRALRSDPRERYENATAFAADLRACAESREPVGAIPLAPTPRRVRSARPAWLVPVVVAAAVVFLVVPIALLALLLSSGGAEAPDRFDLNDMPRGELEKLYPEPEPPSPPLVEPPRDDSQSAAARVRDRYRPADVDYWLAVEELLERDPEGAWSTIVSGPLRQDSRNEVVILTTHRRGREAAEAFCRDWNEHNMVGDVETERRHAKLEQDLKSAGAAAAPYLMDILAAHPRLTFGNGDPARGPTARMQVRALHAVGMLGISEAIPHVVLQCRGPSQTAVSTAALVLEKLTGEDFDAQWLMTPELARIDWWSKSTPKDRVGLEHLVRVLIADLRAGIEGRWEQGGVLEEAMREGQSWWATTGGAMVEDLASVLDTSFPFLETEDVAEQRAAVDRIEEWWRGHRPR